MPETPQSHFHSSLKSHLSLEDRSQCNTLCFFMHHFTLYKETQFAIKVHLSKLNTVMKQKEEFQLGMSHTESPEQGEVIYTQR